MFGLMAAKNATERIAELGRFLEHWYGPRQPEYGEPEERLATKTIPDALRQFYALAGRWPSPNPYDEPDERFYEGQGGHHLGSFDRIQMRPDGQLLFFMEYQGDWKAHVTPTEPDPPVWITGRWGEPTPEEGSRQVASSLSSFLVTHCLMTTIYESANAPYPSAWSNAIDEALEKWFQEKREGVELLWEIEKDGCPQYDGAIFLIDQHVLACVSERGAYRFRTRNPKGIAIIHAVIGHLIRE